MVGGGKRRQQAASWVLLPWRRSFLCDPWQTVCLGPSYGSGEGFLGRISTQGGKGRLVTIPVVWGTPGKLLWSGDSPTETGYRSLSFWRMCFEETIGPSLLQEALGSLSIPRGHRRNFLLFLSHLVEPRLMAVPRHLLWPKSLKWERPDTFGQFATLQETGDQVGASSFSQEQKDFSGFRVYIGSEI